MLTVSCRLVHLEELLNLDGVLVFEQVANFFKSLKRFIWTELHDVVQYFSDVIVQVTQVLLRLGLCKYLLQLLMLFDGLARERFHEVLWILISFKRLHHFLFKL